MRAVVGNKRTAVSVEGAVVDPPALEILLMWTSRISIFVLQRPARVHLRLVNAKLPPSTLANDLPLKCCISANGILPAPGGVFCGRAEPTLFSPTTHNLLQWGPC